MSDERLLPCPFCGGEAEIIEEGFLAEPDYFMIRCKDKNCTMRPKTDFYKDKSKVISFWNTRKPIEKIIDRLEQQKQQYKRRSEETAHVLQGEHFFGKMCSYDHAIDIVKAGGVDETD